MERASYGEEPDDGSSHRPLINAPPNRPSPERLEHELADGAAKCPSYSCHATFCREPGATRSSATSPARLSCLELDHSRRRSRLSHPVTGKTGKLSITHTHAHATPRPRRSRHSGDGTRARVYDRLSVFIKPYTVSSCRDFVYPAAQQQNPDFQFSFCCWAVCVPLRDDCCVWS